ncbi:Flp pilus assembly protein CpaB [Hyphomonas sp.]|uniref:Flp pilus assembly protein CpaB n=1 Tax=Hyphomonas sp. TaxID=87 RepID=UPI003918BB55
MSPVRIVILLLALLAAGGAALLVSRMSAPQVVTETVTQQQRVIQTQEVSQTKVLIVTRDLAIGAPVTADDLAWTDWPEKSVLPTHFTQARTPDAVEEIAGAIVKLPIYASEPILQQRIVKRGEAGLLPVLMEPDMRAIAISISPESASGGFVLPNDRVDLILTFEQEASPATGIMANRTLSQTLLKNVRVLAIDQTYATLPDGGSTRIGSTATLELTPTEVELVTLANRIGSLSIALRPLTEDAVRAAREPRFDLMSGDGGARGITIIRNSKPVAAGVGGN